MAAAGWAPVGRVGAGWAAQVTSYSSAGTNRSERILPPEPPGPRVTVKAVEKFTGPRLRHRVALWRRVRSMVVLVLVGAVIAALLAGIFAAVGGGLALLVHHAAHGGTVSRKG